MAAKSNYCQEFNLQAVPFMTLNQTIKNCMEDAFVYVLPNSEINENSLASLTIKLNLLNGNNQSYHTLLIIEDKACNGFLNNDYLASCQKFQAE